MTITFTGKVSCFGGPHDAGVSPSEGLALYNSVKECSIPHLFLSSQPLNTTGLARRLNPGSMYIACRWDYEKTPVEYLRHTVIYVRNPRNNFCLPAYAVDWGPNENTGRVADLSPSLLNALDLETDDTAEISYSEPGDAIEAYRFVVEHELVEKYRPLNWMTIIAAFVVAVMLILAWVFLKP